MAKIGYPVSQEGRLRTGRGRRLRRLRSRGGTAQAPPRAGARDAVAGTGGGLRPWYADDYRGWPVAPRNRQHPVRGSWLDPRRKELPPRDRHLGARRPARARGTRRGGRTASMRSRADSCGTFGSSPPGVEGIVRIGHFTYGHVDPVVELGQEVKPGQLIGWTFKDEWHLHLSEWRFPGGKPSASRQIQVNPLDPEGKIAPYRDTAPPVIREIRFHQPVGFGLADPTMGRPSSLPAAPASTRAGSRAWSTSAPGSRTSSPSEAGGATSPSSRPTTIRLASTSPSTGPMTGSESSTATCSRPACGPAPRP